MYINAENKSSIKGKKFFKDSMEATFEKPTTRFRNHRLELVAKANITRSGVIHYDNEVGFREHSSIVDKEFLDDIDGLPIVKEHAEINYKNRKEYEIGVVLNPVSSGIYIRADIVIYDPESINKIENKEVEQLSIGLYARKNYKKGSYQGESYDFIQEDIFFNHVALVERGRAGERVRIEEEDKKNNDKGVKKDKKMSDITTEELKEKFKKENQIASLTKLIEDMHKRMSETEERIIMQEENSKIKDKSIEDLKEENRRIRIEEKKKIDEANQRALDSDEKVLISQEREFFKKINVFNEHSRLHEMKKKVIQKFRDDVSLGLLDKKTEDVMFKEETHISNVFYETIKGFILKSIADRELEEKMTFEEVTRISSSNPDDEMDIYEEHVQKNNNLIK